jgi:hypothetical protein
MKRTFAINDVVTLECDKLAEFPRVQGTVLLVAQNQVAVCFELPYAVGLRTIGGIAILEAVPLSQDDEGRFTDLWGIEWRIVE